MSNLQSVPQLLLEASAEISNALLAGMEKHPFADRLRHQATKLAEVAAALASGSVGQDSHSTQHLQAVETSTTEVVLPTADEILRSQLVTVRDLLAKGWFPETLTYVEDLLQENPSLGVQSGAVPYLKAFEKAFWTACRKNHIIAAYVVLEKRPQPDNTIKYALITGGNHLAETVVSHYLQPLADSLGIEKPLKPYLEPGFLEKAATWNNGTE